MKTDKELVLLCRTIFWLCKLMRQWSNNKNNNNNAKLFYFQITHMKYSC